MKNVLKTLKDQKAEVEKEFNTLEQQRQQLIQSAQKAQTDLSQIVAKLTQLQGQWQAIDKLEKDFQDEPKEK